MNRLLYNPTLTAKYSLDLGGLLILNYLNDNKSENVEKLYQHIKHITLQEEDHWFDRFYNLGFIQIKNDIIKLTPKGKVFFSSDTILSPEEYNEVSQIINAWNDIPNTTNHNLKAVEEPQTKTVYKTSLILQMLKRGKLHTLIEDSTYHDGKIPYFESMIVSDIIDTINEFALKFQSEYYPENKLYLPKGILQFFMHPKSGYSEFFTVYFDGVTKKKIGTAEQLEKTGITVKTLKKMYDVMLPPSDRNSDMMKLKCMKQILLLYEQWCGLIKYLDRYYLWNKKYRNLTKVFNYFIFDYVDFIDKNVQGMRPLMFLQVKEGHEIYRQFGAWYYDTYQIQFKVKRNSAEYLLKKNKKFMEERNG